MYYVSFKNNSFCQLHNEMLKYELKLESCLY